MIKRTKIWYLSFLLLLLLDSAYSFLQHYNIPLDGDLPSCVVPRDDIKPLLKSPLGLEALSKNTSYLNPNRFFSHWLVYKYFNGVPLFLQKFTNSINSVYLAIAIAKIVIQLGLIVLLAAAVAGTSNLFRMDFIIAALLIVPFFQTNGYRGQMAIIDPAATYTFFYALPCAFLLLYFFPAIQAFYHGKRPATSSLIKILWIPLALAVCLSGPLNPGIILVFSMILLIWAIRKSAVFSSQKALSESLLGLIQVVPRGLWFYLVPLVLLSVYSLYLGRYNSMNSVSELSLADLYLLLPQGIYYQFTQKLGFPLLFLMLGVNALLIAKRYKTAEGRKVLSLFGWLGLFALIYTLLLPLGGYRAYRPFILRYDTILPITLSLLFLYGISSLYLIKRLSKKGKNWYLPLLIAILFIFTYADEPEFDQNDCERAALAEMAGSTEKIIQLEAECNVLSWEKIKDPATSELNARLLQIWRITEEKRLYRQER